MPTTNRAGVRIHFELEGQGEAPDATHLALGLHSQWVLDAVEAFLDAHVRPARAGSPPCPHIRSTVSIPSKPRPRRSCRAVSAHSARRLSRAAPSALSTGQASKKLL
jgi:hypothetical protein